MSNPSPDSKNDTFAQLENTSHLNRETAADEKITSVKTEDQKLLETVIIDFNKVGMQYLSMGKVEDAKSILKRLVKLCKSYANQDLKLICLTFNNVSCIHKKLGEFRTAMKLLNKAQSHAEEGHAQEYLALTYINLSAIYSELKKYVSSHFTILDMTRALSTPTMEFRYFPKNSKNSKQAKQELFEMTIPTQ
jgi:tetratricopeptide (TPR) repeat protein